MNTAFSWFNVVVVHLDKIVFHTEFLQNVIYLTTFTIQMSRLGTMLDTGISFLLVVLFFAISMIFFAVASGSWLDLKPFVPT